MNTQIARSELLIELAGYEGEMAVMASEIRLGLLEKANNDAAYDRVYTIAKRMHSLKLSGALSDGVALEMLNNMSVYATLVNADDWLYWMKYRMPEATARETCTVIVCELDSGLGFHFCKHGLLAGNNSNLWFPLHDKVTLFQEIERVMVMNHQAVNVTAIEPVRHTDKSVDYIVTYM